MKINTNDDNKIETFGAKTEESFEIGDTGFILNLLRSQLYSNIHRTIVQEYMCNARDAHREVGTPEKKIEVSLPTAFDPYWKVRDFGPGISPDRMSNVFIQYGRSTKRGSNVETGGFGLGAKSGFGYKDSFMINTFIDGVKRIYSAVIDETQQGVLKLMSETPCKEVNGTEICIPVDPKDMTKFATETYSVLRHWKTYPEIKNAANYQYLKDTVKVHKILSGTRWFIENFNRKMIYAVLDEVEYVIPDTMVDYNMVRIGNSKLYLEFKTGEMEVAPNREQLKQSESNKKKIVAILNQFEADAKKDVATQLQSAKTFVEAIALFDTIKGKVAVPFEREQFDWHGQQLISPYNNLGPANMSMTYNIHTIAKIDKKPLSTIRISGADTIFVLSSADFNKTTEKAIQIFLEKEKIDKLKYSKICVISTKHFGPKDIELLNLDKIATYKLDDYYKFMDAKERRKALTKTLFFRLPKLDNNNDYTSYCSNEFYRSSISEFEEDKNKKAYVFLYDDKNPHKEKGYEDISNFTTDRLTLLSSVSGHTIYGFKLSQVSVEKVKEILEEDGTVYVGDLIREVLKKYTTEEIEDAFSYYNAEQNYYSEIKQTALEPRKYGVAFSSIVDRLCDEKAKEKMQKTLDLYLENSSKETREYFELMCEHSKNANRLRKIYSFLKFGNYKSYDLKFISKNHETLTNKIRVLKKAFDEKYIKEYLNLSSNSLQLMKIIHLIDGIEKAGYTEPKCDE